jgi:uncharacterized protein
MAVLLDTGPWVALLSCEPVVAETCFLLARSGFDPVLALQFIQRGVVQLPFVLQEQIEAVSTLFKRYDNVPALLDSTFHIYRRHGRLRIPLITP